MTDCRTSFGVRLPTLYLAQLPRATGIAIISIVGMAYLQRSLPGRLGVASALFGNTPVPAFCSQALAPAYGRDPLAIGRCSGSMSFFASRRWTVRDRQAAALVVILDPVSCCEAVTPGEFISVCRRILAGTART
jgi:hypothetical protein